MKCEATPDLQGVIRAMTAAFAVLDRELTEIDERLSELEERRRAADAKVRGAMRAKSN